MRLRKIEFEISRCPEMEDVLKRALKEQGVERTDIFFSLVRERGSELVRKIRASGKPFEDFFDETVSERIITITKRGDREYVAETGGKFPKHLEMGEGAIEALGRLLLSMMRSLGIGAISVQHDPEHKGSYIASAQERHPTVQSTGPSPATALGNLLRLNSTFFGVVIETNMT